MDRKYKRPFRATPLAAPPAPPAGGHALPLALAAPAGAARSQAQRGLDRQLRMEAGEASRGVQGEGRRGARPALMINRCLAAQPAGRGSPVENAPRLQRRGGAYPLPAFLPSFSLSHYFLE